MTINFRQRRQINALILFISAAVWIMLLFNPGSLMTVAHCPVTDAGVSSASLQMMLAMNPVSSLAAGWCLMLIAMMLPTLFAPICHIIERSFKRRRIRAVTLFLVGYAVIWIAAGFVLIAVMLLLNLLMPQSIVPAVGVGIVAVLWQCSPVKQRCLNRGHNHKELAAFGIAADLDALNFGLTHGVWCVASCWALMLFPMLLSQGHFAAMAIVTYVMISERLEQPRPLSWRLGFPAKLLKIVLARFRIRIQPLKPTA
jgi:predicted metal-binding membrane protein